MSAELPNFLVVGGMKCGTTTLWDMLVQQQRVFMPRAKEPCTLATTDLSTSSGLRKYVRYFKGAEGFSSRGEASTVYTNRAVSERAADQALSILGPQLKLIMVVRHPVDRAISHHAHNCRLGRCGRVFETAASEDSDIIERGRYMWQLDPWLARYPSDQMLVVRTEDLARNAEEVLARVCRFLGCGPPELSVPVSRNTRSDARVRRGVLGAEVVDRLLKSQFYRGVIKPRLPVRMVRVVSDASTRRPSEEQCALPPTEADCRAIWDRCNERLDELASLAGAAQSLWELEDSSSWQRLVSGGA